MIILCNVCKGAVRNPLNHIKCAICNTVCHRNCANAYELPYFCDRCYIDIFPFHSISDNDLDQVFEMDIHELVDVINDIDWEERLPETQEK